MRGENTKPQFLPAQRSATRTQQELFSFFSLAVPEELHFDPAVLVGVDLLACRPHYNGRLWPLDIGFGVASAGRNATKSGIQVKMLS